MLHILSVILIFFVLLAVLVLTHELGHFLAARWLGIAVEEFGFGLPPRLVGLVKVKGKKKPAHWKILRSNASVRMFKDRILSPIYSLNAIPFGGFVKILGEDGEKREDPTSFAAQPARKRFIILFAGILMNFILGAFLFSAGFWYGSPEIADDNMAVKDPKVQVTFVAPNSPAEKAGFKIGDTIKNIGLPANTKVPIDKVNTVQSLAKEWAGEEIIFEVLRGNDVYRLKIQPRVSPPAGQGALGIELARIGIFKYSAWEALKMGPVRSAQLIWIMTDYFRDIIGKLIQAEKVQVDVSGPVGIIVVTNQMKEMGFSYLIQFAAIISVNLAFLNFLPFPALDGGRILFLAIEKIKGRPVSPRLEGAIHAIGLYFLLALMVLITFKDVSRFRDKFEMMWERIVK